MPINILVTEQKFYNQFKNGVGFTDNLGDYNNNLAGSVMNKIKVVRKFRLSWRFEATTSNSIGIRPLGGGLWQITSSVNTTNFANDGLAVGDLMVIEWTDNNGPGNTEDFRIQSMGQGVIIAQQTAGPLPDSSLNGFLNASVNLWGREPQTALIYKFGLIGNNENFNTISKVSGNAQGYYSNSIGLDLGGGVRDTSFQTMQRLGQYEDWRTGTVKARYVQNIDYKTQEFEIEHEFIIVPYYLDGELSNLQNNIIPSLLNGGNSLKYVFNPEFRTVLSNPNTAKNYEFKTDLGSVAWYNENYNGFNNNYKINSISYIEMPSTNAATGLLIGSKTRVTIEVEKLSGNFSGVNERMGVYVSYLPDEIEYQNTTLTNLVDNFIYDAAFNKGGSPATNGQDFITNLNIFPSSTNTLILYFDVEYSSVQKAFLSNKFAQNPIYFIIGVECGDNSLSSGNIDKVLLLADVELYDESPDIPNLMHVNKHDIYAHNKQLGVDTPSTNMTSWNEDGLLVDFEFSINQLQDAFLNSLEFKLVAYNQTTQQFFELDSFPYNVANAIISNNVQQLNENTSRNYILLQNDQFNFVKLQTGSLVAGSQFYSGQFAQKIKWQDWLQNAGVDTVFYDNSKPNDNLNYKTSNYSQLLGYSIHLAIFSNLDGKNQFGVAGNTNYLFLSPEITVYDYDTDANTLIGGTEVWSCQIETFEPTTMTNLNAAILSGQDTLFRATWTNSGGAVSSLTDLWGINRIEETEQPGDLITEMSSVNLPDTNQLLKPSTGTLLNIYLNSGKVVMECLIDGSLVVAGKSYNLSSRIHRDTFEPTGTYKQMSPSGQIKMKADGTFKIKSP